jgi:hypothetical protein
LAAAVAKANRETLTMAHILAVAQQKGGGRERRGRIKDSKGQTEKAEEHGRADIGKAVNVMELNDKCTCEFTEVEVKNVKETA